MNVSELRLGLDPAPPKIEVNVNTYNGSAHSVVEHSYSLHVGTGGSHKHFTQCNVWESSEHITR